MRGSSRFVGFALAAFAVASSQGASAAEASFFVGAAAGRSTIHDGDFDSDTGYKVDGGYRWAVGGSGLIGIEVGYTDLGSFEANDSLAGVKAEMRGPTVGANARFEVAPHWYVGGRAGYLRADLEARTAFGAHASDTVDSWYAGVGFGYDFSNNASLGVSYDYHHLSNKDFDPNPSLVSVDAEFRF